MVGPHFHTTEEAKAAIKKISHNHGIADEGKPVKIAGGSSSNATTFEQGVNSKKKGDDWVPKRGLRGASGSGGRGN